MEIKTRPIDENETFIQFSGRIVVSNKDVKKFEKELQKFIDEFAL